jgi:antitoxin CptB
MTTSSKGAADGDAVFVDEECFRRIQWRSRRGLLENDLLLTQFLESRNGRLLQQEHDGLARLLELPDNELLDLILERQEPSQNLQSAEVTRVLQTLRNLGDLRPNIIR